MIFQIDFLAYNPEYAISTTTYVFIHLWSIFSFMHISQFV